MRSSRNSFKRLSVVFALITLISSCGKDSHLKVTEEKVPNPPILPLDSTNKVDEKKPVPFEHPTVGEVPAPKKQNPLATYKPNSPSQDVKISDPLAKAQFTLSKVGEVVFDRGDIQKCVLERKRGSAATLTIHFEKTSKQTDFTPPSMKFSLKGKFLAPTTLNGSGDKTLGGLVEFDMGGDPTGNTERPHHYENIVGDKVSTQCKLSFRESRDPQGYLIGWFQCKDVGAGGAEIGKYLSDARGTFRCALTERKIK
jgi:hypothetical protein